MDLRSVSSANSLTIFCLSERYSRIEASLIPYSSHSNCHSNSTSFSSSSTSPHAMSNESDWELLSWSFFMLTALDRTLETRASFSLITFRSFLSKVVSSCSWSSTSASLAFVAFCYSVKTGPRFNSSICLNYLISPSSVVTRVVPVDCRWTLGSTHPVRNYVTRGSAA